MYKYLVLLCVSLNVHASNYSLLDAKQYAETFKQARSQISVLQKLIQNNTALNERVELLTKALQDIPYLHYGIGEGDWNSRSQVYRSGDVHINQNPVYRLDGLDCQSFVQTIIALLHSKTLNEFDQKILKIGYGAAGNPNGEIVHYYNRNHFVEADFNRVNQNNGFMQDVTAKGILKQYSKQTSIIITRKNWFSTQSRSNRAIQTFQDYNGQKMSQRLNESYSQLNYPGFDREFVSINYIPKSTLIKQHKGKLMPNDTVFNLIPTPAVLEIINNSKRWYINGRNIKDIIGSQLMVSHLGVLFRKQFHQGEVIYQKITCYKHFLAKQINCRVTPVPCKETICTELMFTHASNLYPRNFYWYQTKGQFFCTPTRPNNVAYSSCNRIETLPLFAYLTQNQNNYSLLSNPAILGIHIEKLV